jgi:phenylalanyl-tRNA synthetase beta chain
MKLPVEWILERVPDVEQTADVEQIADRLTMAGFEVEGKGDSARGPVLDIKVTPNRGDGLSVLGVARELSAAYNVPMQPPPATGPDSRITHHASRIANIVSIEDPDLCPRYLARIIRNVKVGPSPAWIQERIEAAGMRPINNVVDVTNYVMLETGQPLHAFDYDTLRGGRIIVRRAEPGETLQTLDGVDRNLTPDMLVIADAERAVALAGLMGGADTEMTDSTTTVLLESAHFHPLSVRRTARALDMSTEASYRFQRYVDPNGAATAAERACELLAQIGAGEVDPAVIDVQPAPHETRTLTLRPQRVSQMLGFAVTTGQITDTLSRLGFNSDTQHPTPDTLSFTVPSWRPDIVREIDLVEEVGRVLGYEHIPEKLPEGHSTQGGDSQVGRFAQQVRQILAGAGLQEIVSHSLLAPTTLEDSRSEAFRVPIRSALSAELSGLRRSLLPGLLDALERNLRRGNNPLAFFEVGRVFSRDGAGYSETLSIGGVLAGAIGASTWEKRAQPIAADYYSVRGLIERLADNLHITGLRFERSDDPRLHPGRSATVTIGDQFLGYLGELHPRHTADLRLRERVVAFELKFDAFSEAASKARAFQPLSAYPSVSRDLAPRMPAEVPYAQVEAAVQSAAIPFLDHVRLADVFTGQPLPEGTKSLTLAFTLRAPDRTLTDAEVNDAMDRLRAALETACGASFVG